ncbi:MAG: CoA-binding protein [Flavobacteriaceae bacterium]|jgi:predicted CoA-binding protein|nr:CoA-binding protein [Flavobacteriaceae bacterium]|tara:strand:- start:1467 stop:1838 length:372 start_codon:yes stop_codon:yes gene_type:complete
MVKHKKTTLILGASLNPERYSFKATKKLIEKKIKVFLVGRNKGQINGININNKFPLDREIHTISIYLNPSAQEEYVESILSLRPKRVIFNPGTENSNLSNLLFLKEIECENSCTLILLSTNQY